MMVALILLVVPQGVAQTLFWDTNGATTGSSGAAGTWGSNTFWSTNAFGTAATTAYTSGRDTVFSAGSNATGSYTVTVSGTQNTSSINVRDGTVTFSGGTINFNDATPDFIVATGLTTTVNSVVSGANGLAKSGAGKLILSGVNVFTGATTITAGTLSVGTIGNGGVAGNLGAATTTASNLTLGGGTLQYTGATASTNRNFVLTAGTTSTIDVSTGASNLTISGASTATTGALTKVGAGTLTLSGANTFTGAITVNDGVLSISSEGNLGGTASTASLTLNNGTLRTTGADFTVATSLRDIVLGASGGTIDTVNNFTWDNGISGAGSLTKIGTGSLTLLDPTTFTGAFNINAGSVIFDGGNDRLADTVAVTIASGATLNVNTRSDTIGSLDGAGTLTNANAAATAATLTFGGLNTDTNFSGVITNTTGALNLVKTGTGKTILSGAGANAYDGNTTISAGILNLQKASALGTTTGDTTVASGAALEIQNNITVTGEALTLSGTGVGTNGALRNISGANTWTGSVTLAAASQIQSDAGTLTVSGNVSSANLALTLAGAGNTALSGVVGLGTGTLTKTGAGTATLSGANTYTGATTVSGGVLSIQNAGALGTASNAANTTVASGASLQIANNITTTNTGTLVLNGTGTGSGALQNVSGSNVWNSNVTIASNASIFSSTAGTLLTLGNASATSLFTLGGNTVTFDGPGDTWINSNVGVAGDTGGLIKNGTGKLTFYGYNTFYTGATIVNAGSLDLTVGPFNPGIYGINGSLTIGAGSSNPALAGTVNVNIAANSYANQLSPASAVTINSDGALNVGSSTGVGSLTLNGGQVNLTAGTNLSPTGGITSNANNAHQTSLISGGQVSLGAPTVFTVARDSTIASDLTVSSVLAGTSLVKQGAGVLTLSGTTANTYTGTTAINDGTLILNKSAGVNAVGTGAITVGDGAGAASSANLVLLASNQIANTNAITLNSDGRLALNNFSASIATLSGTGLLDLSTSGYLTVGANNGSSAFGGSIAGTGTLEKAGTGTLTFNSAISYAGTLLLSGNGGTLQLNGVNATIGTLTLAANSTIDFAGSSATLNLTNLNLNGFTLTVTNWAGAADFFYTANWAGGAVHDTMGNAPMNLVTFNGSTASRTGWDSYDNQIRPNVPEPATYGAFLLGALTALFAWRRSRRQ